jgi:hypothetical protein
MAALKKNGTELMRLRRVDDTGIGNADLEIVISVRSNGWLLKSSRWLGPFKENHQWKQWVRFKPFDEKTTSTMPQQVQYLLNDRGYVAVKGTLDDVIEGWQKLVAGAR